MRQGPRMAALLLAAGAGLACAQAPAVYRCGTTYSQTPCAGATRLTPEDGRTADEAAAASAQAQRNARLAGTMEKERLAQERQVAGPSMLVVGRPQAAASAATAAARKPQGQPKPFKASAPGPAPEGSKKAKKKSSG